jgi:3-carboxy-cis,cis-muconate cycloisomerase
MGERGPAVARRVAAELGLRLPDAAWHAQRDEWVGLGLEVALVTGSLGKLATDIALMAQAEVAELAEPSGGGRGGSSAMPHKRNPVASMVALAAATRTPQRAAALLAAMCQQHERGLGNWQAELAEWPGLFLSAHGAAHALAQAVAGLSIDAERMQHNIDALQGLIFAEAATAVLAGALGRDRAKAMLEELCRRAIAERRPLHALVRQTVDADPVLGDAVEVAQLDAAFDPRVAVTPAAAQAGARLARLRAQTLALTAPPWA